LPIAPAARIDSSVAKNDRSEDRPAIPQGADVNCQCLEFRQAVRTIEPDRLKAELQTREL